MYMLLIILLMLSQDAAFAQNIHKIALQASSCGSPVPPPLLPGSPALPTLGVVVWF